MRRKTTEEFIRDAKAVHGDKYSYDKVKYIKNNTPVIITCPIHGDFQMIPNNHTSKKQGCPYCAGNKKKTTEEFIKEAKAVHGDRYNYSKTIYNGSNKKVIITCPKHGDFPILPSSHKAGHGCPWCAGNKKKTLEEFIADARAVHGDKYNYDKVNYINVDTPVTITCPKHGDFLQTPYKHKDGQGCYECAKEKLSGLFTDTKDEFIVKAIFVHGNRYNYDKVEYNGDKEDVTITCPIHGDFLQTPHNHKAGCGCPKCNQSHLEAETMLLLEQNNITYEPQMKFPWLRSNKNWPMKLDFYLPEHNIAIECQGNQHYMEEESGYYTKELLHQIQERDRLKLKLCEEHGIQIYYIKYDENIEEQMNEILNKCKL